MNGELFMDKRIRYENIFKMAVANEYAAGRATYGELSQKYDIPRSTIAKWIQKYKKHNGNSSLIQVPQPPEFLNVTKQLQSTNKTSESITVVINGLELKSDIKTLLRLLQGAKHV